MKTGRGILGLWAVCMAVGLARLPAGAADGHDDHGGGEAHHGAHHEAHHGHHARHLAVFSGVTRASGESDFTLGADFEYRLPHFEGLLGVGALVDATFGDGGHVIVAAPLFVHPHGGVKLVAAPGIERVDGGGKGHGGDHAGKALAGGGGKGSHTEFLFRLGVGYDLHLGGWSLTPAYNVDFVDGHRASVIGVNVGFGF